MIIIGAGHRARSGEASGGAAFEAHKRENQPFHISNLVSR